MSPLMMNVMHTVQRNGFEIELVVNQDDSTAVRVLDLARDAEAFFHFNRRTEVAVARRLADAYCTSEQEESIFADRLRQTRREPTRDAATVGSVTPRPSRSRIAASPTPAY
jgi:hypothetical protein